MDIKIVLLGDCSVGKTSIALRFVKNEFNHYTESTIGASFLSKVIEVKPTHSFSSSGSNEKESSAEQSKNVRLQIWDTAGQEKYHALAPMYYRGAHAAILVFDITKPQSFEHLKRWVKELHENNNTKSIGGKMILYICGNKYDLKNERRISIVEAHDYATSVDASYIETSARDGSNVQELFHKIANRSLDVFAHLKADEEVVDDGTVNFEASSSKQCRTCC